jgi:hypothetical protein
MRTVMTWILLFVCASLVAVAWRGGEWLLQPVVGVWLESTSPPEAHPGTCEVTIGNLVRADRFQEVSQEVALPRVGVKFVRCRFPTSVPIPKKNEAAIKVIIQQVSKSDEPSKEFLQLFADRFDTSPRKRDWRGQAVNGDCRDYIALDFGMEYRSELSGIAGRPWLSRDNREKPVPASLVLMRFRVPAAHEVESSSWNSERSSLKFPVTYDGRNIFWLPVDSSSKQGCEIFALPILPASVVDQLVTAEAKERDRFLRHNLEWNLWGRAGILMATFLIIRYRKVILGRYRKAIFGAFRRSARTAAEVSARSSRALDEAERKIRDG